MATGTTHQSVTPEQKAPESKAGETARACLTCDFYELPVPPAVSGSCHRNAPSAGIGGAPFFGWWPMTRPDDWCGEWRVETKKS
jgi:hypothetical protein